jgi:hypothetical protein
MSHSAPHIGDGPSPRRQQGANGEDKESFVGRRGKLGRQHGKDGQCKRCEVHVKTVSMGDVVPLAEPVAIISP